MHSSLSRTRRPSEGGFTLIELLVVIIILGILSAVVVFAVRGAGDKGSSAAYTTDLKTLRTAEEAYCAKAGTYGTMDQLVGAAPVAPGGPTYKFLNERSALNDVKVGTGGGTCGGTSFAFSSNAEVKIAGAEDNWPTDPGTGYKSSAFGYPLNLNVYEPLVYLNSDSTFRPGLSEIPVRIPKGQTRFAADGVTPLMRPYDNDTFRFNLKHNVKFHDGSDFNADDVMWSWRERQATGQTLGTVTGSLGYDPNACCNSVTAATPRYNSVEKIDDFTVDFTPKIANLRLPEQIVHPEGAIVKRGHHFDDANNAPRVTPCDACAGAPADGAAGGWGTGPFKRVSYTPTVSAIVDRFDGYWDFNNAASVKRLNVTFFPNNVNRTNALLSGNYDMALDLPAESTTTATGQGLRVVRSSQAGRNQMILVNKVGNPGFAETADVNVRKAISLAIKRTPDGTGDDYVTTGFGAGNASPGRLMSPAAVLGSSESIVTALPYDQAQARNLLEASGYVCATPTCGTNEIRQKNGVPLKMVLFGIVDTTDTQYGFLAGALKAVGIDTDIRKFATTPPRSAFYAANVNAPQWHLNIESPNQNDGNPAFFPLLRFWGRAAGSPPSTYRFAPCFSGTVYDPVYTAANTCPFDDLGAASNLATATAGVQSASANMQKILVNDTAIAIPLAGRFRIYGMKNTVNLTDVHGSQTNQSWHTLTKQGG